MSITETDEKIFDLAGQCGDLLARAAKAHYHSATRPIVERMWSPIEQLAAYALFCVVHHIPMADREAKATFVWSDESRAFEDEKMDERQRLTLTVWPQMRVGPYRADFVMRLVDEAGVCVWAALECDGHDYHERTKEQAEADKTRGRYFQSVGLLVLRYTGREIWRDPLAVAIGAIQIMQKRAQGAF